jgi:hypothetical protein
MPDINQQLAQAQLMIQQLQQQQATAAVQLQETALPSSDFIPTTQVNEQGEASTVVETGPK